MCIISCHRYLMFMQMTPLRLCLSSGPFILTYFVHIFTCFRSGILQSLVWFRIPAGPCPINRHVPNTVLPEFFFFSMTRQPLMGQGFLIIEASRSHSHPHARFDSSELLISPTHRPLPDNTQHSQQIGGFRTYSLSGRAAADPQFKLCGHWDRQREGLSWWC